MEETIFDKIIKKEIPSWIIWEDQTHVAFLTPFGNTPGATVVIPKNNPGQYFTDVKEQVFLNLAIAARTVAIKLENAFNTKIGLIFEGTAVPYIHAKLFPMHGLEGVVIDGEHSTETVFFEEYPGWLTTKAGPKMSNDELDKIQRLILDAERSKE